VDLVQQVFRAQIGRAQFRAGIVYNFLGEPQPFGDCQRVGAPRQAKNQMIGGFERVQVEFEAGVDDAFGGMRESFQLRVMRRDDVGNPAFQQVGEHRPRQRGAFLRVGARAELVQQHQRAVIRALEDAHKLADVPGERGKRLLDGLFIADVGENVAEQAQARAGLRRNLHAGLRHQHQ